MEKIEKQLKEAKIRSHSKSAINCFLILIEYIKPITYYSNYENCNLLKFFSYLFHCTEKTTKMFHALLKTNYIKKIIKV